MTNLNREAYRKLIEGDLEWLLSQPRTLERDHIEQIVRWSIRAEYDHCDPTPISPDLLRERGWDVPVMVAANWSGQRLVDGYDYRLHESGKLIVYTSSGNFIWPRPIRTVGDLRRLEELLESEVTT